MINDVTAILLDYSNKYTLNKTLSSLNNLQHIIKEVFVLQQKNTSKETTNKTDCYDIRYKAFENSNLSRTLMDTVNNINSSYILFLQNPDYLSPVINTESLQLSNKKAGFVAFYSLQENTIQRPLLVRTDFLKKQQILSKLQTPFKEGILSAWFSYIDNPSLSFKADLVKPVRTNNTTSNKEKGKFIQKYQLEKAKTNHPSITILISNYNMEKYLDTAITSCILQNEEPDEILIIDDGSTDSSYIKIKEWKDHPLIKVFKKRNEGKAKALNYLLPNITSEFVLELDADDWLDPDAISLIKRQLSNLPKDVSVLYGNLRRWKQTNDDIIFKGKSIGSPIKVPDDLLSYHFPLGPRIYRSATLIKEGGFPVINFENGRLYEDVSVLNHLIKKNHRFHYSDLTVYNIREHKESITKNNLTKWDEFIKGLKNNEKAKEQ